ncbi:septum formation family protein [Sanguibacter sp. 25GB23B1]|uniref:septum formation family protein n=1 Tax=unclassified Sanguibacter TaxID=2645534 RepID=UPI0032AE99FB
MSSVPPPPPGPSDEQPDPGTPDEQPAPADPPAPAVPPAPDTPPAAPAPHVPLAPPTPPGPPVPPAPDAQQPGASEQPPGAPAQPGYDTSTFHAPAWDGHAGPPPSIPLSSYGAPTTGPVPTGPAPGQGYPQGQGYAAGPGYAPGPGHAPGQGYAPGAGYAQGPGQAGPMPSWGAPPPVKAGSRAVLFSVLGVVVLALVAVGAYFAFFAGDGAEPLEADVEESVEAYAQQVVVGNCLEELPGDGDVDTVVVVPCDEDHEAQVIAAKKFSSSSDFPGAADVKADSVEKCTVDAIVAEDVDLSLVELSVWTPTEESWEQGDRQGLCIAAVPDGLDSSLLD